MNILLLALILAYPLAAHATIATGLPLGPWLLGAIVTVVALRLLARHPATAGVLLLLAAAILVASARIGDAVVLLPPVIVPLLLGATFGLSLLPERTPVITRFAETTEGNLPEPVKRYTRGVTWLWTGVFAALALQGALLGVLADPTLWSLFTNAINYVLVAIVFALEFAVRRRRFPERTRRGFVAFVTQVARTDWRRLGDYGATRQ